MNFKLATQMYTLRNLVHTKAGFELCLRRVAEIGYRGVQLSAVGCVNGANPEVSAADARKMLDSYGLQCIATHRHWDSLYNDLDREVEFHHTLGCDYVAISAMPESYRSRGIDGYAEWVAQAQVLSQKLQDAGLRFAYHNHSFEFERGGSARKMFFDVIMEAQDPSLLILLDIYWAETAGLNSVRLIEKLHGRIPIVHFKDKEVVDGNPTFAPIGEGNMDWQTILPALADAGTQWCAVELDECRRDPFDCLRSSYDFLNAFDN